jgi:predicted 3-demethylubiquinone-9 3-methyltransferase (glyoxalase superfamily)
MEFVCMVGNVDRDFSLVPAVTFIVDCDDDLVIKIFADNLD